jgi:broad specificity phosphatase PhoE
MRSLILVRHSQSRLDPELPPSQWKLTSLGRARCISLAERLVLLKPRHLVSSSEKKAIETGRIVADFLEARLDVFDGLHEHERDEVPIMTDAGQFEAAVSSVFRRPAERVLGSETADEAHQRFSESIEIVMHDRPGGNVVVFSHGTVITLLASRAAGIDPYPFWQKLGMPAICVLSWPEMEMLDLVPVVE